MRRRRATDYSTVFRKPVASFPRLLPAFISPVVLRPVVKSLEDRRTFHPLGRLRPAAALTRGSRALVSRGPSFVYPTARVGFAAPAAVSICVRRHVRREALFGLNRVGAGKRVSKRRKYSAFSNVDC